MRKFLIGIPIAVAVLTGAVATADKEETDRKKETEKEVVCPISKKPVDPSVSIEVNGEKTLFCCEGCVKPYQTKVLQLEDKGPLTCPISKQDAKKETGLIHRTAEMVYFCCNKCRGKYMADNRMEVKDAGAAKCPVSGKPAKAEHALTVNGEQVYFCCDKCPKGYLKKLGAKEIKAPTTCPISKQPAKESTGLVHVKHTMVYFCCNKCRGKYAASNFPQKEKTEGKDKGLEKASAEKKAS